MAMFLCASCADTFRGHTSFCWAFTPSGRCAIKSKRDKPTACKNVIGSLTTRMRNRQQQPNHWDAIFFLNLLTISVSNIGFFVFFYKPISIGQSYLWCFSRNKTWNDHTNTTRIRCC